MDGLAKDVVGLMIGNLVGALAALILVVAAISDIRSYRIPNALPLALVILFGFFLLGEGVPSDVWSNVLHFGIALAASMGLFALRWIGGGDAKLYAASALWFPLSAAPVLLVAITVLGGVIAVIALIARKFVLKSASNEPADRRIAYGIAIAAGTLLTAAVIGTNPPLNSQSAMSRDTNSRGVAAFQSMTDN